MDGVRTVSRAITEVDGFRLAAYDIHKQRLLSCSGATQLTVHHRAGGDTIWKPTDCWDSPHAVTQAAWAHPEFGHIIAVGCNDGHVLVYVETPNTHFVPGDGAADGHTTQWSLRLEARHTTSPITCIAFSPKQQGLCLAAGSADGLVRLYTSAEVLNPHEWVLDNTIDAGSPVHSLTWRHHSPDIVPALLIGTQGSVAVWVFNAPHNTWQISGPPQPMSKPVVACAWAPTLGRPLELVAAADGATVHVLSLAGAIDVLQIASVAQLKHPAAVWKVEWNMLGNWLAVGTEDGAVQLWRPNLLDEWALQHTVMGVQPQDGMGSQ